MSYDTYHMILKIIPIIMAGVHIFRYTKIKESRVSFPLYLYFALFPFVSETLTPTMDFLLKAVFLIGFAGLIYRKCRWFCFNFYEVGFFIAVMITLLINYERIDFGKASVAIVNLGYIFVFSIYAFNDINSKERLIQILKLFFINAVVLSVCVILEYYLVKIPRPEVSMNNPNYLAFYFCIAMVIGIYINETKNLSKLLYLILCIFAIYLTGSHSVFLSLVLVLLFRMTFLVKAGLFRRLFITAVIAVSILYLFIVIFSGNTNYGLLRYFVKSSDLVRVYIWQNAWETFRTNIFFGVGWGEYSFINYSVYGDLEWVTHNDILRVMVEVGLCGLTAMALYLRKVITRLITYSDRKAYFLGSLFLIVFSLSLAHNNMNSILFWWTLSLPLYKNCFT